MKCEDAHQVEFILPCEDIPLVEFMYLVINTHAR